MAELSGQLEPARTLRSARVHRPVEQRMMLVAPPETGALTPDEKAENRRIAGLRMRIEHVIGSVKRCSIAKDKLRLWREHIPDRVMETCCGLHNLRLQYRPWSYSISDELW